MNNNFNVKDFDQIYNMIDPLRDTIERILSSVRTRLTFMADTIRSEDSNLSGCVENMRITMEKMFNSLNECLLTMKNDLGEYEAATLSNEAEIANQVENINGTLSSIVSSLDNISF